MWPFKDKQKTVKVGDQTITLQPKPSSFPFKMPSINMPKPKPKPAAPTPQPPTFPPPSEPSVASAPAPQKKPGLFGQQPKTVQVGDQTITLQPKPNRFGIGLPKMPKPAAPTPKPQAQPKPEQEKQDITTLDLKLQKPKFGISVPKIGMPKRPGEEPAAQPAAAQGTAAAVGKPSAWKNYVQGLVQKNTKLEEALRDQGVKSSLFEFVQRMLIASLMVSAIVAVTVMLLFLRLGFSVAIDLVLSLVLFIGVFQASLNALLNFPLSKKKSSAKLIERDLLFAARDMIISLRSGMPLFNAITSISTGYGEASKEFAKIVKRVQLGMPLEDAIDDTVAQTTSPSFRRIMLQASVSIKAGADVVIALQSVIDQVSQERIIELRRYGQKLNALAMFYMLFGVILPSMGIAVITILTTFISFFTVDISVLEFVLVGLLFLQVVFLQLIRSSRPVFSM